MRTASMRQTLLAIAAVAIALPLAPAARASMLPFTGTIEIDLLGQLTTFAGEGVATINGSGPGAHVASLALTAGAFVTTGLAISLTSPAAFPVQGIQVTAANGAGAFAETAMGTLRGTMPILGVAKVCLFGTCAGGPVANVSVPLSVIGVGGMGVATGLANVTVQGAPWTTGTAVNSLPFTPYTETRMGFAHGPASHASSTAAPSGAIQLVTPIVVWTNLGVDQPSVFGFVTATLHFVPEPAPLALLAGGCALLGARARRRAAQAAAQSS